MKNRSRSSIFISFLFVLFSTPVSAFRPAALLVVRSSSSTPPSISIVSSTRTRNKRLGYKRVGGGSPTLLRMGLNDSPLELCEESVDQVIEEVRRELGTIFGYDAKSREVGITGEIGLVEIDGPTIVVRLSGRFWHATDTVMMRVKSYVRQRIPEVIDVTLSMADSDIVDDNRLNTAGEKPRLF